MNKNKTSVLVDVAFRPEKIPEKRIASALKPLRWTGGGTFIGAGKGYGERDLTFEGKADVAVLRRVAANMRRWKGVTGLLFRSGARAQDL
jgi:hypothetical protein